MKVFLLVVLITASGAAFAQNRGTEAEQEACTPDVFRLCNDQVPDETEILACLTKKARLLSPACRSVIQPRKAKRRRAHRR